jgi:hypothetical protein
MDHRPALGAGEKIVRSALSVLIFLLATGIAFAAEPVGRLFYTPAQRAQLDMLRSQKSIAPAVPEQPEPVAVPETITYGGIVRRSDGATTVWINNHVVNDGKTNDGLAISSKPRSDDRISVKLPQASGSVDLKVGQTVEVVSGAIAESYTRRSASVPSASKPAVRARDSTGPMGDTAAATAKDASRNEEDDERGRR